MSKDEELKKLKIRIEELEFIKDFQQDLIAEYEIETRDLNSKKYLPEQLTKENQISLNNYFHIFNYQKLDNLF